MTATLLPSNLTFLEWTQLLRNTYPSENIAIFDKSDWRDFCSMLLLNRNFEDKYLPDARMFSDWRDWASEFLLSVGA